MTLTLRRTLAACTMLAATGGVLALADASRLAAGAKAGDPQRDPALTAVGRREAGLAAEGHAALVVVLDPSCGACEEARLDLAADSTLGLASLAVDVGVISRDRLAAAELALAPGFFPAYLLFDGAGKPLATRRGYGTPTLLRAWVQMSIPP